MTVLTVAGLLSAQVPASAQYTANGYQCRDFASVGFGYSLSPCASYDSGSSQVHTYMYVNQGTTDVHLKIRLDQVGSGGSVTPLTNWIDYYNNPATNGSSQVSLPGPTVSVGAGQYVTEVALTESGNWYGFVQSPVVADAPAPPSSISCLDYTPSGGWHPLNKVAADIFSPYYPTNAQVLNGINDNATDIQFESFGGDEMWRYQDVSGTCVYETAFFGTTDRFRFIHHQVVGQDFGFWWPMVVPGPWEYFSSLSGDETVPNAVHSHDPFNNTWHTWTRSQAISPSAQPLTTKVTGSTTPPTAKVSAGPTTAGSPVTISAAASQAGSAPIRNYTIDPGDGSTPIGPQGGATATVTYATPGTYEAKVTVTDDDGATSFSTQEVTVTDPAATPPPPGAPAYVARAASATGTTSAMSTKMTVAHAVSAGDTLAVSMMLTNTHTGSVAATDSQGNSYSVAADQSDGAGDRTLVLTATGVKPLSTTDTITVTYPATGEQHVAVDELANVKAVEQHAASTGAAGSNFTSGPTPTTTATDELVFGVAGVQGGSAATWTNGFTKLPTLFVSDDQLATGYKNVAATGAYAATGTCDHQWMAAAVTFLPSAPPLTAKLSVTPATDNTYTAMADARGSIAGGNPIASYTFDFGDGTIVGPQSSPTATHTYAKVGTNTVKVTVTDTAGVTSTAQSAAPSWTSTTDASAITNVGRVASDAAATASTSLALHPGSTTKPGDALLVSAMLTNTQSGSVTVTDTRGNTYTPISDTPDGAGDRTLIFAATGTIALAPTDTITLSYPTTGEHHAAVDEFSGVTAVDQHAAASGPAGTFDTGSTPTTTAANELVFSVAGIQGGTPEVWSTGVTTPLSTLSVNNDQLLTGYQVVTAAGTYNATGPTEKTWMAGIVTLK